MFVLSLTLPNLLGYTLSGSALLFGIYHVFARLVVRRSARGFDDMFDASFIERMLDWKELRSHPEQFKAHLAETTHVGGVHHPMASILSQFFYYPRVMEDDVVLGSAVARVLDQSLGRLIMWVELNRLVAPMLGLGSTVMGIILGAREYAETMSPGALMHSISLAMICTLASCCTVIVESMNLVLLQRVESQMADQMFELLGKLRAVLREDARLTELQKAERGCQAKAQRAAEQPRPDTSETKGAPLAKAATATVDIDQQLAALPGNGGAHHD